MTQKWSNLTDNVIFIQKITKFFDEYVRKNQFYQIIVVLRKFSNFKIFRKFSKRETNGKFRI